MDSSEDLKVAALLWLRFSHKLPIVCTEAVMFGIADVIGASADKVLEVEVKISKSDLKREWTTKADKHARYQNGIPGGFVPNYFYILVPKSLEDFVLSEVKARPKYGVLVMDAEGLRSAKSARRLHDGKPTQRFLETTTKRMSSELAVLHAQNCRLNRKLRLDSQLEDQQCKNEQSTKPEPANDL